MAEQGTTPGKLGVKDWKKIGKGLGIALAGSGLAYLGNDVVPVLPDVGMGWLAPLAAVGVNILYKWLTDTRG